MSKNTTNRVKYTSNVSVDCILFGYSNEQLKVLLIKKKALPNVREQQYAIPGDLLFEGESLDEAAERILLDLTSVKGVFLEQFHTFGETDRTSHEKDQEWLNAFRLEPKARVITVAYYALVRAEDYTPKPSSFAGESTWTAIEDVPELAFDHNHILEVALEKLRKELMDEQVGIELLPKKFTLTELQNLYQAILGIELDKRNFRKSLKKKKGLKELDEKVKGAANRPAKLYTYIKD